MKVGTYTNGITELGIWGTFEPLHQGTSPKNGTRGGQVCK